MSEAIWNAFIEEQAPNQPIDYTSFYTWLEGEDPTLAENFFTFLNQSTNKVSDLFETYTLTALPGETVWGPLLGRVISTLEGLDPCTPKDEISSEFFSKFNMSEVNGLAEIFYEKFFPAAPEGIDSFDKLLAAVHTEPPPAAIEEELIDNINTSKCNSTFQQSHASAFLTAASDFLSAHTVPQLFTGKIAIDSTSPLFSSPAGIKVIWYDNNPSTMVLAEGVCNDAGEFPINYSAITGIAGYEPTEYTSAGVKFQDSQGNFFDVTGGSGGFLAKVFPPDGITIDAELTPTSAATVLYPSYALTVAAPANLLALLAKEDGSEPDSTEAAILIAALGAFQTSHSITITKLNDVRIKGGLRNYLISQNSPNINDPYVLQFDAHVSIEPIYQNMKFRRWIIWKNLQSISSIASINRSEIVRMRNDFNATVGSGDKISDYEAAALHQKAKTIAYYLDNLTIDWRINHA